MFSRSRERGGGVFRRLFQTACRQRGVKFFVLQPCSPQLNGQVERANRTHTEGFYEVTPWSLPIAELNRELLAWEHSCNTVRAHHVFSNLTPKKRTLVSLIYRARTHV